MNGMCVKNHIHIAYTAVACRGRGGGERGDSPGHPRQGGIQRVKSQKLKCCN